MPDLASVDRHVNKKETCYNSCTAHRPLHLLPRLHLPRQTTTCQLPSLTFTFPASSSPCRCPWRGRPCTSSRTGRSWWRSRRWSRWSLWWWNSPVRAATGHNGSPGWIEAPMGRLRPILEAEATAATLTAATPSHHTIDGGRAVGGC